MIHNLNLKLCLVLLLLFHIELGYGGRGFRGISRSLGRSASSSSRSVATSRVSSSRSSTSRLSSSRSSTAGSSRSGSDSNFAKQDWGSPQSKGMYIGGGSFQNPKTNQESNYGSPVNKGTYLGGGGFQNPKTNQESNYGSPQNKGTFLGGSGLQNPKTNQRTNYGFPQNKGTTYGTNIGTSFGSGPRSINKYKPGKNGFSKKTVALGAAAGFIGGAALGVAGTSAMYGVYHRYLMYQQLMGYNHDLSCFSGCPFNSHCRWGFCECNNGFERQWGACEKAGEKISSIRTPTVDPYVTCADSQTCFEIDMNLVCNTTLGKCACRSNMRWNTTECQIYLDVDCSNITYQSPTSTTIPVTANKTIQVGEKLKTNAENHTMEAIGTIDTPLHNSILSQIDKNATKEEILEAYCRDIDILSFEFHAEKEEEPNSPLAVGSIIGILISVLLFISLGALCIVCFCNCKGYINYCIKGKMTRSNAHTYPEVQRMEGNQESGILMHQINSRPGYSPQPAYSPIPSENRPNFENTSPVEQHPGYPPSNQAYIDPASNLHASPSPIHPTQPGYLPICRQKNEVSSPGGIYRSNAPPYSPEYRV